MAELRIVVLVAAVSGVIGALAGAEPAGWGPADLAWTGLFAGAVTYAASRARRWTWVVLAAAPAALGTGAALTTMGVLALAGAGVAVLARDRSRLLGAVVAALSVNALLRVELDAQGLSAALSAVAVAPVLVSAWSRLHPEERRLVRRVAAGTVIACLVATVGLAVGAALSYGDAQAGADAVQAGLDAVRNDDTEEAVLQLDEAGEHLDQAHDGAVTWGLAARLVPAIGHQARAFEVVTGEGADLADAAARAAVEADTDLLTFDDGRLDLDAIASFEEPLAAVFATLDRADRRIEEARSLWLAGPLAGGAADFAREVDRALPLAEVAAEGVRLAPALLGEERPRRYFIAFTQPAESRGLGGFVGNFGLLTAIDGQLDLARSGRIQQLRRATDPDDRRITGPADYVARYQRFHPEDALQDVTLSPDMPSVGQVYEELYPQTGAQPLDGVIAVDPVALAALLEFTGPIQVDGLDEPLTSRNAADILMREQYLTFQGSETERVDVLDEASRVTFEELTSGDLPGPREVADVMGPVVRQGRFLMHAVAPEEQHLLELTGLDGALPPVDDGDFLSLVTQNSANNKIDIFLHRTVRYDVTYDPDDGHVEATATVELANRAPASGLPDAVIANNDQGFPLGTNRLYLSWYTPLEVDTVTLDGEVIPVEGQRELDRWVYSTSITIGPGQTRTLELDLDGRIRPGATYRLGVAPQPLVNPDRLVVSVRPTSAWLASRGRGLTIAGERAFVDYEPDEDDTLTATFIPR